MSSKISQKREKQDTRKLFVSSLIKKAKRNKKIILLTGDLGFNFVEEFANKFPERFINCGIAEQNMIGVATGLKLSGLEPYCYSDGVFINYRCLEQIRDAWIQGINIKVVGTGASGFLGFTHNFQKGEAEPLKALAKLLKKEKHYIRL